MRKITTSEMEKAIRSTMWASIGAVTSEGTPYAIETTLFFESDRICFMINPRGSSAHNIKSNPHVLLKFRQTSPDLSNWLGVFRFRLGLFIKENEMI